MQFLTLSPSHFLLCPPSFPAPSFRLAYTSSFLPLGLPLCLPSCFPLIKAGVSVTIWRDAHHVLTSPFAEQHSQKALMVLPFLLRVAKWSLCDLVWFWLYTKEISMFLLFIILVYLFIVLVFLRALFLLLFIWVWGDGRQIIHSCFLFWPCIRFRTQCSSLLFWKSPSTRLKRWPASLLTWMVDARKIELRNLSF